MSMGCQDSQDSRMIMSFGNRPKAVASCNATHPRACGYLSAVIHLAGAPLAEESVCLAAGGILSA